MKSLASLLSIATIASAQTVSPPEFTRTEAPLSSATPFGLGAADDRYLQVHDDVNTARTINRLAFRLDGPETGNGNIAFNATLRLSRAAAGITALTPDANFASNHGSGLVTHSSIAFNLPAANTLALPGRPLDRVLQLPAPFLFPGGGPLVWEIEFNSRSVTQAHTYDAAAGNADANPQPALGNFGTGCRTTSNDAPLRLDVVSSLEWPFGAVRFGCLVTNVRRENTADNLVFIMMGFNRSNFGPVPLPYLVPGTTGAPSGACTLYTSIADILVSSPVNVQNGSSFLVFECGIHVAREFNGGNAYLQALAISPTANPSGIALSNGAVVHIVAPYAATPIGRVLGNGHGNVSGSAFPRAGLVVQFD